MMTKKWFAAVLAVVMVLGLLPISWAHSPAFATNLGPSIAHVQLVHLAPFAEDASVTVALNGTPALLDFGYGDSTEYIELPSGEYLVEVMPTGTTTVAISATLSIEPNMHYSAIAYGDGVNQDLGLMLLEDDLSAPAAGFFKIRLGHLAPFAPGAATADVRLADGTPVLENVDFGAVTGFIPLPAGEYDLIITTPGGDTTLINPVPVTLGDGDIVSAFASGEGDNQALAVFALPAGFEGFFLDETVVPAPMARVRVVHAVADAPPVDVLVNGMPVPALEGIAFKDVTDYVPVPAGTYTVTVVVSLTSDPVLTETLTLEDGEDYTVVAFGTVDDEEDFPLGVLVAVDDNTLPSAGMTRARFFHLIPGAPDVNVAIKDGPELLTGVTYGQVTEYVEVAAGTYDLELRPVGIPLPIPVPGVELSPDSVYSFFAVGTVASPEIVQNVDAQAAEPAYTFYFPFVNNSD